MAARLQHAGIHAGGRTVTGQILQPSMSVAEAIMKTADDVDADLIVMSTHALTGPARALLGSVSDAVVRSSHRAVLLPRRGAPGDSTEAHGADKDAVSTAT
jgi:nucleotide-binding universal stress UspA family protein